MESRADARWPRELPPLPEIPPTDPQAEVKKLRYQVELDVYKADHGAAVGLDQAAENARIALQKAADDARIAREKADWDARLERDKQEALAIIERTKAFWANEYAQSQAANAAYIEVAKGALDRAATKATFVQNAAATVSSVYAGVLGLTFAVAAGKPLPASGLAPAFFLGVAIALAAAYLSFLTKLDKTTPARPTGVIPYDQLLRRNTFLEWVGAPILTRRKCLQAAIVSLSLGAILLPLPFLEVPDETLKAIVIGGVIAVVLIPFFVDV